MNNKRGQGLSTGTIVLLILAVVVLVILILGFTIGWEKIAPYVSRENVDEVAGSCETACATQSNYDYCNLERKLVDGDKNKIKTSCGVFAEVSQFGIYGVDGCDTIDCKTSCDNLKINGAVGSATQATYDVSALATEGNCYISEA